MNLCDPFNFIYNTKNEEDIFPFLCFGVCVKICWFFCLYIDFSRLKVGIKTERGRGESVSRSDKVGSLRSFSYFHIVCEKNYFEWCKRKDCRAVVLGWSVKKI
jgi:hypothetical protein